MKAKKERTVDRKTVLKTINDLSEGDTFIDEDGYKCHVLSNLKTEGQIVFKYYGKNKKYWHYFIESYFWFEIRLSQSMIKIKFKKK